MKKILLIAFYTATLALTAAEPVLKVGLISDTHIRTWKSSCVTLKEALKLFKAHKVDMIVNTGDISEVHHKQSYLNYRNTVKEVFSDMSKKPPEIFVFAWHDRVRRASEPQENVFNDVKKYLEFEHEMYDIFKVKGYTFLLFPQGMDFKRYENTIAKACRENPGKPVFVLDHIPPYNTVYNSLTWGEKKRREILDKYPQVVHLSGHVHGTLTNELNIWQGNFTAVNMGCLSGWAGALIGNSPSGMESDTAMIMEIYPEKLVFRRFFSKSKKEYKNNEPWIIPIPFDKNSAPYNLARRKAKAVAPEFAENAKLDVAVNEKNVKLSFPQALHSDGVFNYKIMFYSQKNGRWEKFSRKDIIGNFMHTGKKRDMAVIYNLSAGYFEKGKNYRIEVIPAGFFGNEGKPLASEFKMKNAPYGKVIFESHDPMKDCTFMSGLLHGKPLKLDADGFYIHDIQNARFVLPDKVWEGSKKNTNFRLTVDMHMKQSEERGWTLVMRNPVPMRNATTRIQTPPGDSGVFRFVIEFKKQADDYKYYLLIREGLKGKIRFNYVKFELLD